MIQPAQIHNEQIYSRQNEAVQPTKTWWAGKSFPAGTTFEEVDTGIQSMIVCGEADVSNINIYLSFEAAKTALDMLVTDGGVTNYADCPGKDGSVPLDVPITVSVRGEQLPNTKMQSITIPLYVQVADGT